MNQVITDSLQSFWSSRWPLSWCAVRSTSVLAVNRFRMALMDSLENSWLQTSQWQTYLLSLIYYRFHSPGAAAEAGANRKSTKYADLSADYFFLPLAFETPGPISNDALIFIKELGRCISVLSRDAR